MPRTSYDRMVRRLGTLQWSAERAPEVSPTVGLLRRKLAGVRGRDVGQILDVVEGAGSRYVVLGGWGVDALAGRRTRRHADLDLAVDDGSDEPTTAAAASLVDAGYGLVRTDHVPDALFGHRYLYEDRWGRLVDLHPVHVGNGSRPEQPGIPVLVADAIVAGRIGERPVDCLSLAYQLAIHRQHQRRTTDRVDLALLESLAP